MLLAAIFVAPAAAAGQRAVHLVYMRGAGAEQCPSDAELQKGVIARLGRDPFWGRGARPIWITISGAGDELVATIAAQAEDSGGAQVHAVTSRRHECGELAAAVELALAIAIDPEAALGPRAGPPAGAPDRVEPVADPPAPPVLRPPAPEMTTLTTSPPRPTSGQRGARATHWFAGGGVLVSAGTTPATTAGLVLGVGGRWRDWSLALEGRVDYPRELPVESGAVSAAPMFAAVVPCRHLRWFAACLVEAAGATRGSGRGLPGARADVTPYLATGVRLAGETSVDSRFALNVHLDVLAPLTPTHLAVSQLPVWDTPAASVALGVSAIQRFW